MLVLCVGMYRACSTWQYGVACQILERHRAARRLGFVEGIYFDGKVEPEPEGGAWRVLKAHDAHERFAEELAAGRALAIYSYRDLRDVVFSYMHKTGADFEQLLERGFFQLCLENDRFWRARPGVLVQSYESLIAEPARGVLEIAGHLGVELAEGEAEEIAEALSFESNRRKVADLTARLEAGGEELSAEDQSRFDPVSLLHWNHIRRGGAGTWRELASPRQRAIMARFLAPWLAENGYEADDNPGATLLDAELLEATRRRSYARDGEDVLLDRLFIGRKGTYLDLDAPDPIRDNPSYYFYLRGWRGVTVGSKDRSLGRFAIERPADFNLARDPDWGDVSGRGLAGLIAEYGIDPPDFVAVSDRADPVAVVLNLPLASWRPKVLVVDASGARGGSDTPPPWEPTLLWHGYLLAASHGVNRFYLRGDLAESLELFASPPGEPDNFECVVTAEEIAEVVETPSPRLEPEPAPAVEVDHRTIPLAEFLVERDAWQRERDAFQRERDAWQRERDAIQQERDARQIERDARQTERDGRQMERDSIQMERDSIQMERDAVQRERDSVQRERDAFQRERDARIAERAADLAALAEARARADRLELELERTQDELDREQAGSETARGVWAIDRERHEAERARWEVERAEFLKLAQEAESYHRPYRLIDRLGVGSAIHRRATRPSKTIRP